MLPKETAGEWGEVREWLTVEEASRKWYYLRPREQHGPPWWLRGKESAWDIGDPGLIPGSGRSPGEGKGSTPVFWPGEFHGQWCLSGYCAWGGKEEETTKWLTLHGKPAQPGHRTGVVIQFSVQFSRSVVSDSLRPHESQHARPPCPSPTLEFTQTHVHRVSDAIQTSHPLSSPSPPAPNPS